LQTDGSKPSLTAVKEKQKVANPEPEGAWTRPETYVEALVRTRSFRRAHRERPRTQPVSPRLWLSTIPFLALLVLLGVLAAAMMVLAFPGNQPLQNPRPTVKEQGVAQRGWFEEAQKEMHR
jgi:hypothetical protein